MRAKGKGERKSIDVDDDDNNTDASEAISTTSDDEAAADATAAVRHAIQAKLDALHATEHEARRGVQVDLLLADVDLMRAHAEHTAAVLALQEAAAFSQMACTLHCCIAATSEATTRAALVANEERCMAEMRAAFAVIPAAAVAPPPAEVSSPSPVAGGGVPAVVARRPLPSARTAPQSSSRLRFLLNAHINHKQGLQEDDNVESECEVQNVATCSAEEVARESRMVASLRATVQLVQEVGA